MDYALSWQHIIATYWNANTSVWHSEVELVCHLEPTLLQGFDHLWGIFLDFRVLFDNLAPVSSICGLFWIVWHVRLDASKYGLPTLCLSFVPWSCTHHHHTASLNGIFSTLMYCQNWYILPNPVRQSPAKVWTANKASTAKNKITRAYMASMKYFPRQIWIKNWSWWRRSPVNCIISPPGSWFRWPTAFAAQHAACGPGVCAIAKHACPQGAPQASY